MTELSPDNRALIANMITEARLLIGATNDTLTEAQRQSNIHAYPVRAHSPNI